MPPIGKRTGDQSNITIHNIYFRNVPGANRHQIGHNLTKYQKKWKLLYKIWLPKTFRYIHRTKSKKNFKYKVIYTGNCHPKCILTLRKKYFKKPLRITYKKNIECKINKKKVLWKSWSVIEFRYTLGLIIKKTGLNQFKVVCANILALIYYNIILKFN